MKKLLTIAALTTLITACASTSTETNVPKLGLSFTDSSWNGTNLPNGQQCKKNGGNGSTPAMNVTNVPKDTVLFHVAYSDVSWKGGKNGFHGIIGHEHTGGSQAYLISVPGDIVNNFPTGTSLVKDNQGFKGWAIHKGYMPPCSVKGKTHKYEAEVTAIDVNGEVLAINTIQMALY